MSIQYSKKALKATFESKKWRVSHYRGKGDAGDIEHLALVDKASEDRPITA